MAHLYQVTGQHWGYARANGSSCHLSFQCPLERCQLDPCLYLSVVTIPGRAAGLTASKDGGDGDTTFITMEPSGNNRQGKVARRVSSPTFLSLHPLLLEMTRRLLWRRAGTDEVIFFIVGLMRGVPEQMLLRVRCCSLTVVCFYLNKKIRFSCTGCGGGSVCRTWGYFRAIAINQISDCSSNISDSSF